MIVFIQISVRKFSEHKKFLRIFHPPKYNMPELKTSNETYFLYYTGLCEHEQIMFLYVSPQESSEALSQMQDMFSKAEKITKKKICIAIVSNDSPFFVDILEQGEKKALHNTHIFIVCCIHFSF